MVDMHVRPHAQHAASPSPLRGPALPIGIAVTAIGMLLSLGGVAVPTGDAVYELPAPLAVTRLPGVQQSAVVSVDPCSEAAVTQAIARGDDAATIAGFGGGAAFRDAVVASNAPCISLVDPERLWVVVNKATPLVPVDFAPAALGAVPMQATTRSDRVREDVGAAIAALGEAAQAADAGRIGVNNGYRSFSLQGATYSAYVRAEGEDVANAGSAKPGHSEHQTGLALDIVACDDRCGSIESFGETTQASWVAEHAWEFGFIVRYEAEGSPVTGYAPEPWHLRYVGPELARAYHEGGFRTLEEFFGLPAAPDYPG